MLFSVQLSYYFPYQRINDIAANNGIQAVQGPGCRATAGYLLFYLPVNKSRENHDEQARKPSFFTPLPTYGSSSSCPHKCCQTSPVASPSTWQDCPSIMYPATPPSLCSPKTGKHLQHTSLKTDLAFLTRQPNPTAHVNTG